MLLLILFEVEFEEEQFKSKQAIVGRNDVWK
jgi:hypothetical protein